MLHYYHIMLFITVVYLLICGYCNNKLDLTRPVRPPSTSGFGFDHITAVDISYSTSLQNFIQIGPPSAEKKLRHVDFQDGGS